MGAANIRLDKPAAYTLPVAEAYSDTDLTAQVGYPDHAAQVVDFHNSDTDPQTASWVDENGVALTRAIPGGGSYTPLSPVATLDGDGSGANISALCYWWPILGHSINEA